MSCCKEQLNPGRMFHDCRIYYLIICVASVLAATGCAGLETPTAIPYRTPTPDPTGGPVNEKGSPKYLEGMELFRQSCSECHGDKGTGSETGPPLIHEAYHPYHHPDFSFKAAVKRGVPAHHWHFGNMPPVPDLSEADVENIICYVRSLQDASGMPGIAPC